MVVHAYAPCSLLTIGDDGALPFQGYGISMNCAIGRYVRVTVQTRDGSGSYACIADARSARVGTHPTEYGFLHRIMRYFEVDGIDVSISYDLPPGSGVGAGASAAVAITGALAIYAGKKLPSQHVATIAHQIHSECTGQSGSLPRYLAAASGGIALYRLSPSSSTLVTPVTHDQRSLQELEARLLLTQVTTRTGAIAHAKTHCAVGDRHARGIAWRVQSLPMQAMSALRARDYIMLGEVIATQNALQEELISGCSTPEMCKIVEIGRTYQALSVQENGTGSVTFLCRPEQRPALQSALRRAGFPVIPIAIARSGLRVWHVKEITGYPLLAEAV